MTLAEIPFKANARTISMKWLNNIISASRKTLESSGRARVLATLRQMDDDTLRRLGYSPEKVTAGVQAWPWGTNAAAEVVAVAQPVSGARADRSTAAVQSHSDSAELEHAA
jgi:hypothetical protein